MINIWFLNNYFLSILKTFRPSRIQNANLKAWFFQALEVCVMNNHFDIKWRQNDTLL
jgi:hypothetical protein